MSLRVTVQSGGTASAHVDLVTIVPISGSRVTLIEVQDLWRVVGQAITGPDGTCEIDTSRAAPGGFFYATAEAGPAITMMAIAGTSLPQAITINELTTVAAVYCASQFLDDGRIGGDAFGLSIAAGMNANLVDVTTGEASAVLTSSPNATETITWRETYSLANLLAFCVRGGLPACDVLFALTTPPGGLTTDTIAAMHDIARFPANKVHQLFELSRGLEPYQPALEQPPDAWTLAVKVNDSGNDQHMFGGPGNLAFDRQGRAWIANNVVQGGPQSTPWSIVLEPNGKPAPMSPFTGGGLLGPGFGVAVHEDRVWIGNFGWGGDYPDGSVSLFDTNACPISVPNGYSQGLDRVQGVAVDSQGNVWMASYGNGSVVVYPCGEQSSAVVYPDANSPQTDFIPFDVAIAEDGTAWVTNSNSVRSTLCHFELVNGQLNLLSESPCGRTAKGVVIDDQHDVIWVASGGDDHVYAFDSNGNELGKFQGGGMDGPWGICLDGDGNVWPGNFGPLVKKDEHTNIFQGRVTKLAGAKSPSGKHLGTPLTPDSGYTLPTAGSQVLLHDGTPLYGEGKPPSFTPAMRTTGIQIDQAGNVWTCNNWKPDFYVDHNVGNPGGDGMIIWIGLARPPASAFKR